MATVGDDGVDFSRETGFVGYLGVDGSVDELTGVNKGGVNGVKGWAWTWR